MLGTSRFRHLRSHRLWRALALICVVGGLIGWFRSRVDPFEQLAARVRARGHPTSRMELQRLFPFQPQAYSNYLHCLTLCSNLPPFPTGLSGWVWRGLPPADPRPPILTAVQVAEASEWLSKSTKTLDELLPWLEGPSDFGYRHVSADLKNGTPVAAAIQGFGLRSALANQRGDVGASLTDIVAALRLLRRQAPDLLPTILRINFTRILAVELDPLVRQRRLSVSQLAQLEGVLNELLEAPSLNSSLRWQWVDTFEEVRRESGEPTRWWLEPDRQLKVEMFLYAISGLKRGEFAAMMELQDVYAEAFVGPMSQRRVQEQAYQKQLIATGKRLWYPKGYVIIESKLPLMESELWYEGWLKTMAATLALERFRRQHGHLPANLEEVYPANRAWALVDPNDGELLHYRKTATGYLIYSVGLNGIDDGGRPEGIPGGNSAGPLNGDITMEMSLEPGDPR